jgi:hypothetical protein
LGYLKLWRSCGFVGRLVEQRGGKPKNEVVDGVEENEGFWKILNDGNVPALDDIKQSTPDEEVKKVDKRLFK